MYFLSVCTAFLSCHLKKKKLGLPSLVQSLSTLGNPLEVQWLGLHTPTAGSPGSVPGWSTEIPYAALCGQKKKKKKKRTNSKKKKLRFFKKPTTSIVGLLYQFVFDVHYYIHFLFFLISWWSSPTLKWMLGSLALIHSECVLIQ